jgi:hypothetical protein
VAFPTSTAYLLPVVPHFSPETDNFSQRSNILTSSSNSNRASRISLTQQTGCQYCSKWSSIPCGHSEESTLGDTMDPLTALSLAANIVQLIDFGVSIVSKWDQLYKPVHGALDENTALEKASVRLQQFSNGVQGYLSQAQQRSPQGARAQCDQALEEICVECGELSKTLVEELEKLKVLQDHRDKNRKGITQAVKRLWSQKKIEETAQKLNSLKMDLNAQVLVPLRYCSIGPL